jgi:hypothetical protein
MADRALITEKRIWPSHFPIGHSTQQSLTADRRRLTTREKTTTMRHLSDQSIAPTAPIPLRLPPKPKQYSLERSDQFRAPTPDSETSPEFGILATIEG